MDREEVQQMFMPPHFKQLTDIENLSESIRAAVNEYVRRTGVKIEWVGFEYEERTQANFVEKIKVIFEETEIEANDRLYTRIVGNTDIPEQFDAEK